MSAPVHDAAEVGRAAETIVAARRVLVVLSHGAEPATAALACDLAEAAGAAVDGGDLDCSQAAGPTIARIGAVTADPEELRDRADLVVLWFGAAAGGARDFVTRFVAPPTAGGGPRRVIAVGPHAVDAAEHLAVPSAAEVDLARLVHAAVAGLPAAAPPALAAPLRTLHEAIGRAGCVGVVTAHDDPVGLVPWAVAGLVRAIAHRTPAFEVPLVRVGAASAVCTWRYGASGAIARADRLGAEFRPAEFDAARLVGRGEVDCVVAVGLLRPAVEATLAAAGEGVAVIRIAGDDAAVRSRLAALHAAVQERSRGGPA